MGRGPSAGERLDDPASDRRIEQRLAGGNDPDRTDELLGRRGLEEEAAGSRSERVVDIRVDIERGQHHDSRRERLVGGQLTRGCDAVKPRHPDVHEDHIRTHSTGGVDGFDPVRGLGNHRNVRLCGEDQPETGPDELLIVGQQHPDRHRVTSGTGIIAATWNPRPGRGPASRVPP
jgi:hypothetical protein